MRLCERCNSKMAPGRPRVRRGKQLWCQTCAKDIDAPSGRYRPGSDISTEAHVDPTDIVPNTEAWNPNQHGYMEVPEKGPHRALMMHLRTHHRLNGDTIAGWKDMSHAELEAQHQRTHAFEDSNRGGSMERWMPDPHTHDRRHFDPHRDGTMHSLSTKEPDMPIVAMDSRCEDESLYANVRLPAHEAIEAGKSLISVGMQALGRLTKVAHDSGDGQTIYHCPFCGSGQVLARSDKTIECEFCHTSFTVQVQPEYSAFPQTMDGQPIQVPGMPGQIDEPVGGGPQDPSMPGAPDAGVDPNADTDQDGIPDQQDPDADGDGFNDADPASADNQPPWLKKGLLTATGARLPLQDFVRHLAIKHADESERPAVLRTVRATRSQS